MRKMLLLLLTLIGSVGAWAEETVITDLNNLSNSKVYVLKSGRSNGTTNHYLLYHTAATGNLSSTYGSGHTMEYSSTTTNFQFAIYQQHGKYYFYNIEASKFIGNAATNNAAIPLVDLPTNDIEIRKESTVTDYPFMLSTNRSGALNVAATTGCHGVVNWSGGYNSKGDNGNAYQIIEVGDLSAELQTSISEKINQGAILAPAQAAVANASDTRVGAYKTTAVSALNAAISAYNRNQTTETFNAVKTAYNNLIAEESNKVTLSAGETFTIKCVEDSRGYMVYSTVNGKGSETYPNLAANGYSTFPSTISEEGVYPHWAFITIDGQDYLYNVQKQQFLKPEGVIPFSNRGYDFDFIAIENLLYEIKFTSNNRYLSFSPGWGLNNAVRTESGIDNGCKFYLDKTGNTVSADVVTAVTNKHNLGLWQDNQLAVLGYVGAYPKTLRSAIEGLTEYSQISTFESNNTKVSITDNGYYFLRSATNQNKSNAYMTYNETSKCCAYPLANGEKLSAKHVWQFTPIQGEDGYKLKSCNLGNYLQTANAPEVSPISSDFANGYKYVFTDQGDAKFIIADGDKEVIRTEGNGAVNRWLGYNKDATWYVIPAEDLDLTIGATGYATAYLPFDVTLPEGLTAYAVTDANNTTATLKSQMSIPANNGAILMGTENTTYKVSIATASSSADWANNKLHGTNTDTYVQDDAYVLANGTSGVGLYKATKSNGAWLNHANKAYLPASALTGANVNALRFVFDDEATAIEGVVSEQQEGAIYDLSGRRVQKAQKGIYIINGKKVVK